MKKNKMSMIGHIVFGLGMIIIGGILGIAIQHTNCSPCPDQQGQDCAEGWIYFESQYFVEEKDGDVIREITGIEKTWWRSTMKEPSKHIMGDDYWLELTPTRTEYLDLDTTCYRRKDCGEGE